MSYTTAARVRTICGFDENEDVTDAMIEEHVDQSYGVLIARIGAKYDITKLVASSRFTGSPGEMLLKRIQELLAGWYLLGDEFWYDDFGRQNRGGDRLTKAEDLIDDILNGKTATRLIDNNGVEFDHINTGRESAGLIQAGGATPDGQIFSTTDER